MLKTIHLFIHYAEAAQYNTNKSRKTKNTTKVKPN